MTLTLVHADEEHYRLESDRLAVDCQWLGDQWSLGLEQRDGGAWVRLLDSIPPTAATSDVAIGSPVFQSCVGRANPVAGELLFVGQFGRRYFSGALTLTEENITFEIGDRWTGPLPLATFSWTWSVRAANARVTGSSNFQVGTVARFSATDASMVLRTGARKYSVESFAAAGKIGFRYSLEEEMPPGTLQYCCRMDLL